MVVQGAVPKADFGGASSMDERLTPKQQFCAPLLSALLFGGGAAGIADIYVHIRDIVPLSARDWESNPLEKRLARWHSTLANALRHFCAVGILKEDGHCRWTLTDKGIAVAREFKLLSNDGVLIERSLLRKKLDEFAAEFEKMYVVARRPNPPPETKEP